jgi:hypothetical protein
VAAAMPALPINILRREAPTLFSELNLLTRSSRWVYGRVAGETMAERVRYAWLQWAAANYR